MLNFQKKIILASKSPRRQQLLRKLGISFETYSIDLEEHYPASIPTTQVATYLAHKKAQTVSEKIRSDDLIITADTTVILGDKLLEKAHNKQKAKNMLDQLSGKQHSVITGVCIATADSTDIFSVTTLVDFKTLSSFEINYYIDNFQPFDKAGSYGIQEWMGMVGIEKITGSYYNVVGLPVFALYQHLRRYLATDFD